MTSFLNLFSNFDDLSKKKTIHDYASDFKEIKTSYTPALTQGEKFKKYQSKIKYNLEKKIRKMKIEEGFDNLNVSNNGLYMQTQNVINNSDYSSQQQSISTLQQQYQDTLKQYENLLTQVTGSTSQYMDRVNPNNPYLGKNIRSTNGAIYYVTQQGVAKLYPNMDIYNSTVGLNGCPANGYQQLDFTWTSDLIEGTMLPTKPPLLIGSNMVAGQSCGNEGSNVFVDTLVNNPINSYIGCYNNSPPITIIRFNPVMGSSNETNGYTTMASSVYHGNNDCCGPWHAFDNDNNTYWHSFADTDGNPYSNGNYIGGNNVTFTNSNGQQVNVKGEFIQLTCSTNSLIPLVKYDLVGRLDCCGVPNGRDPNTWYILGWNPSNSTWNQVDYQSNISFNYQMQTFNISNPQPYGAYIILITVVGDANSPTDTRYCVQISTWNLYTTSNYVSNSTAMTNIGYMSFDQCQKYALTSSNQYFGIQGVDSNGNGNCMIGESLTAAQIYGEGFIYTNVALWSSQTDGKGTIASFNNTGALNVLDSNSQIIFSTDSSKATPSNYLGCYNDCYLGRGLPTPITIGTNAGSTYDSCSSAAQSGNWKYFGLQFTQPNGTSECWVGNDMNSAISMGKATNCTSSGNTQVGGTCSNAVFSTSSTAGSNYFLILQDDGNMCIYRGTSPSDNQGEIYCTMTNGQQKEPNPNFAASKGKTGQSWMSIGTTLAQGEFIGSSDGSIYLIMQTDGNLVLYTNSSASGCSLSSAAGNKNVGQQDINALYQLNSIGIKNNIGQLAYVDQDAKIHSYPNDDKMGTSNYTLVASGIDSAGNDIPGASYGGATLESCEASCNNNTDCGGFVMNAAKNICWPKTPAFYPNGNISINSDREIYYRSQAPITTPIGVSTKVNSTDTLTYQSYVNGGNIGSQYGLANATAVQKQQLQDFQNTMNLLANQIASLTGEFGTGSEEAENQSQANMQGIKGYLKDYKKTTDNIKGFTVGIDNILNDSDIVVLQKNYDYLFWSILATGAVLVTMNIVKK